ncbi:MAG: hypothetical protein DRJ38_00205 [Thermoprotei archaeon]|nr:MAG: hypothetical protein DRJ38_00205 [Thermoprotei archaeon]
MWVAIIPRSIFLLEYAEMGTMHFVVPDNELLYDYYTASDKFKMIDNGAYELGRPLPDEEFVYLAAQIDADEMVAPDVLMDGERSLELTKHFLESYKPSWCRVCAVPQGRNPEEFIEYYGKVAKLDVDTIGLPIWLQKKFGARFAVFSKLRKKNLLRRDVAHHLLGLDDFNELKQYPKGAIRSVDTSLPLTLAYHKVERPVDGLSRVPVNARFDGFQHFLARRLTGRLLQIASSC